MRVCSLRERVVRESHDHLISATTIALYVWNGQKDVCFGRMLKKSASGVLASFRSSTGTRPPRHSAARTDLVLLIRRTVRPRGYASGPSLAAALLDSLFEHPVKVSCVSPGVQAIESLLFKVGFFAAC
jgi:hypothetical protein